MLSKAIFLFFCGLNLAFGTKTKGFDVVNVPHEAFHGLFSTKAVTEMLCTLECTKDDECLAFHYNKTTEICEMGYLKYRIDLAKGSGLEVKAAKGHLPEKEPHLLVLGKNGYFDLSLNPQSSPSLQMTTNVDGHIFWEQDSGFMGCHTWNSPNKCYHWSFGSDTLTPKANFPDIRQSPAIVEVGSSLVWVLGGKDSTSALNVTTLIYNKRQDTWTSANTPTMPLGLQGLTATPINRQRNKFLITGGLPDEGFVSVRNHVYDWYGKTWTQVGELPRGAVFQHRALFFRGESRRDDKVFILGGLSDGISSADVEIFDTQTYTFTTLPEKMLLPLHHFGVVQVRNKILTLGGRRGTGTDPPPIPFVNPGPVFQMDVQTGVWSNTGMVTPKVFNIFFVKFYNH